jgi:hypothetical protein
MRWYDWERFLQFRRCLWLGLGATSIWAVVCFDGELSGAGREVAVEELCRRSRSELLSGEIEEVRVAEGGLGGGVDECDVVERQLIHCRIVRGERCGGNGTKQPVVGPRTSTSVCDSGAFILPRPSRTLLLLEFCENRRWGQTELRASMGERHLDASRSKTL